MAGRAGVEPRGNVHSQLLKACSGDGAGFERPPIERCGFGTVALGQHDERFAVLLQALLLRGVD